MLEALHSRLAGVIVECLDWSDLVSRYDGEGTLFYVDPPYWGSESDYGRQLFSRSEFSKLAEQLHGIRGRFLLSINDVPEVRALFDWATIEPVNTTYSISRETGARGSRAELLIRNFVP